MEAAAEMREWLEAGSATPVEIDDFVDFCSIFDDGGITGRYECYRLWARLLRHRRTPFRRHQIFDFAQELKVYLRHVTGGEVVDADAPENAVAISTHDFVKFVVRHLDDAF